MFSPTFWKMTIIGIYLSISMLVIYNTTFYQPKYYTVSLWENFSIAQNLLEIVKSSPLSENENPSNYSSIPPDYPSPNWKLIAIILDPLEPAQSIALLNDEENTYKISLGEALPYGGKLLEIQERRIRLLIKGQEKFLDLLP